MDLISNSLAISLPAALSNGLATITASNEALAQDAEQVADPDAGNIAAALIGAQQTLLAAEAAASVIKTADRMVGSLFDTYA